MVTRVSTAGSYSAVLANLQAAQLRQSIAGDQVATQKNGTDLKAYAKDAEVLTAMRTVQARVQVYLDKNSMIADRLGTQNEALVQIADAAQAARQAIADALASDRADTLMVELNAQFANAVDGLNARNGGKYVFAGGQINTKPMAATSMADLTSGPPLASFFRNDDFQAQSKVDDATTVTVGILATDIATDLMTSFQTMQAFEEGPSGPFGGPLTAAQRTFLEGQLAAWDQVRSDVTTIAARNGLTQNRVDSVRDRLNDRDSTLAGLVGDITAADMAEAVTRLQQAQLSVQAAAQVFLSLQNTSLLNILRP